MLSRNNQKILLLYQHAVSGNENDKQVVKEF